MVEDVRHVKGSGIAPEGDTFSFSGSD